MTVRSSTPIRAYPSSPDADGSTARSAEQTVDGMESFFAFFVNAIGAAICIAVISSALIYLLRPMINVFVQKFIVASWERRRLADANLKVPDWLTSAAEKFEVPQREEKLARLENDFVAASSPDGVSLFSRVRTLKTRPGQLRDELFMHSVQSEAKAAVASPSNNRSLFLVATADAQEDLKGAVAYFEVIAREHPELAARMATFEPSKDNSERDQIAVGTAAALQAAQVELSASADRALDRLQLSLMSAAIWPTRLLALAIGATLALLGMRTLVLGNMPVYVAVGLSGGLLSLFISDALAALARRGTR